MQSGVILRSYNYISSEKSEQESVYISNKVETKLNDIVSNAQSSINDLLSESSNILKDKLSNVDLEVDKLNAQLSEEINNIKKSVNKEMTSLKNEYEKLIKEQEEVFDNYIGSLESQVKEILINLFENFFFKEYQDTSNLDSIIQECLSQLEDSKNIRISMNKDLFKRFQETHQETLDMLTQNNITLSFHNKDNLILEFKTECACIEVDFNKQMESLKDTLMNS